MLGNVLPVFADERETYCSPVPPGSVAVGVPHPAKFAADCRFNPPSLPLVPAPVLLFAHGVGQPDEVKPLSNVRRTDARSAQIGGPDCISQCFHFSSYTGEPVPAVSTRNLLSKDDWRAALADEVAEHWPQVSLVCSAFSLSG
jgi:hypothetical protein